MEMVGESIVLNLVKRVLDVKDFRKLVIQPTLVHLELWSEAAEILLLGTALTESGLRYLKQRGGGPALGLFQIEKVTHEDIWTSYLMKDKNKKLQANVKWLLSRTPLDEQLIHNLAYATAIGLAIGPMT